MIKYTCSDAPKMLNNPQWENGKTVSHREKRENKLEIVLQRSKPASDAAV